MLRSLASLMLRVPESIRPFREVPVSGGLFHKLRYRALPSDQKVWAQVEAGPSAGFGLELILVPGRRKREIFKAVLAERLRPGDAVYGLGANIGTR
jgi:hypothetical protein